MSARIGRRWWVPGALLAACCLGLVPLRARSPRAPAQAAPSTQLTVQAIFGEHRLEPPPLGEPEWSLDGKTLAYIRDLPAGKELRGVDAATGRSRQLLSAETLSQWLDPWPQTWLQRTGFGRRPPRRYLWSPRGDALLLRSATRLVWYDLKTGRARQLVVGTSLLTDPKISPDGRWVAFLRDYNLWLASVTTGRLRRLTSNGAESLRDGQLDWIYPEELELFTAYWWSPDSSRIAYLQFNESGVRRYPLIDPGSLDAEIYWTRYPRAGTPNPVVRLGVVRVSGGKTVWMSTGTDPGVYLPRVAWLPGSRSLAVERLNRAQNRLDLLFADPVAGRSRLVISEEDRYWINVGDAPDFLPDGRFIWSSERTGFRHLYLYSPSGALLRPLTSGPWMVTDIAGVDAKQGLVYFVSTRSNPLERQLDRVRLDGSRLERVSAQLGTHDVLMSPDAADYLDTFSTIQTPPRQDLRTAAGKLLATLSDGRIPGLDRIRLGPSRFLQLHAADGSLLDGEMIEPPDFSPARRYPVLIYVYGGPETQNVRDMWGGATFLWHELMAEHGYIVFLLDNRGSYFRGHAFETPVYRRFGTVELEDQLVGVRYLQSLPYVDSSRIGVWGWSYGGHMTLHLLFREGRIFKAGVAVAPVTDWRLYDTIYTERYMGTPLENPRGYLAGSPLAYASLLQGQLLLIHGTGDDNVHFSNTTALIQKLIASGRYAGHVQLMIFPGRGHPISDWPARVQLFTRVTAFLLNNL